MRRDVREYTEARLREYPKLKGRKNEREARLWCRAIDETLKEQPHKRRFVELRYFEQLVDEEVQAKLPLSRSGYLRWRADFVGTVAAKAAWYGLIKP